MGQLSSAEAQKLWLEVTAYAQSILSVEQARVRADQSGRTDDYMKYVQAQGYSAQRRDVLRRIIGSHIKEEET